MFQNIRERAHKLGQIKGNFGFRVRVRVRKNCKILYLDIQSNRSADFHCDYSK